MRKFYKPTLSTSQLAKPVTKSNELPGSLTQVYPLGQMQATENAMVGSTVSDPYQRSASPDPTIISEARSSFEDSSVTSVSGEERHPVLAACPDQVLHDLLLPTVPQAVAPCNDLEQTKHVVCGNNREVCVDINNREL